MKGIFNKGIQELVETKFGTAGWEKVKKVAKCDEPFFSASEDYPDQMTLDLVVASAEVSGLSEEEVMLEFGKFWVTNTGASAYPTYYKLAGSDARSFLLSMDKVHAKVTKTVAKAKPPEFRYEALPDGGLSIHYRSARHLCTVLRGLITGVGIHFNEDLQVEETACVKTGAPHCTMEVTFHGE